MFTIGIDASNLRQGGGRTHLIELLRYAQPIDYEISKVIVWASKETLNLIEDRIWIEKRNHEFLEKSLFHRTFWQIFILSKQALIGKCNLLFIPGGSFYGYFSPIVSMSQNMLPFQFKEMRRYGFSLTFFRLLILRLIQRSTFRKSNGLIFLSKFAQNIISKNLRTSSFKFSIIPHGINPLFFNKPKSQFSIREYSRKNPYKIIYVSTIDVYKHQCTVVEAVFKLREKTGWEITLDLVGPNYPPYLKKLNCVLRKYDIRQEWVKLYGKVNYNEIYKIYNNSDLFVFASSCENLPNILLEAMASGLPIVTSNKGPMPEVLGECGIYFNPENSEDLYQVLESFISDVSSRTKSAQTSNAISVKYNWLECSQKTFSFFQEICQLS
jgi:glycosyltransferase involved in cell wall biosynthesis